MGPLELVLVVALGVLLLGGRALPDVGNALGRATGELAHADTRREQTLEGEHGE